jgi:hypothetical protein
VRFTSLAHLLTPAFLKATWRTMNRHAESGVDGLSTEHFAGEMEQRVEEICAQLKEGVFRRAKLTRGFFNDPTMQRCHAASGKNSAAFSDSPCRRRR